MKWNVDPTIPPASPNAAARYAEALAARVQDRIWLVQEQHDETWSVTHTPTQRTLDGCPSEELARACIASGAVLRMLNDAETGRLGRELAARAMVRMRTDGQVRGAATAA
jgi:hypothetical protein